MKFASVTVLVIMTSSVMSYRLVDIQNDAEAYAFEEQTEETEEWKENITKLTEERTDFNDVIDSDEKNNSSSLIELLHKKIVDLENSNIKIKDELAKTQKEIGRQTVEPKRRKVANVQVQLDTKTVIDQPKRDDFWTLLCSISKYLFSGFMSFFNLKM